MFDEAASIKKMLGMRGMTQAKLAGVLGVSQPYIANKLRLLAYSDEERRRILELGLSERHARTLLRIKDTRVRLEAIETCGRGKMNVARCEILVDSILDDLGREAIREASHTERIISFERSLEYSLSLLGEFGIRTRVDRKTYGERVYFSICIG